MVPTCCLKPGSVLCPSFNRVQLQLGGFECKVLLYTQMSDCLKLWSLAQSDRELLFVERMRIKKQLQGERKWNLPPSVLVLVLTKWIWTRKILLSILEAKFTLFCLPPLSSLVGDSTMMLRDKPDTTTTAMSFKGDEAVVSDTKNESRWQV